MRIIARNGLRSLRRGKDDAILTNPNAQRRIQNRTKKMCIRDSGKSALVLVTARLKYVADSEWGSRRYLDVSLLDE